MKIKKNLIVLLICIFNFGKVPQAAAIPLTETYKQGVYDISKFAGYFGTIRLTTPGKPVTFIIIDRSGMERTLILFDKQDQEVIAGPVMQGDTMVIVGTGEIVISSFL